MSSVRIRIAALVAFSFTAVACGQVSAQDKGPSSNPVGAFKTKTQPEPAVAGVTLDAKQIEAVKQVNAYFNQLQGLKGTFVQTDPEKKKLRGKIFVNRPGKLRFEYNLPSRQLIVSDGQTVSIQDLDLKTDDPVPLDQTPFKMLLQKDVDILRDARISEVQEADDLIVVALQDKSSDVSGRIRLFMSKAPQIELKEWVATDSQGKDTRVELANLVKSDDLDPALFKIVSPGMRPNNQ